MGTYGGYSPQPELYGGGKRRLQHIHEALLRVSKTDAGLDVSPPWQAAGAGFVFLEDLATARALDAAWGTNVRASNEFDPRRTIDMLPRWEACFIVFPRFGESKVERRAKLAFKWRSLGKDPTKSQIADDLAERAPDVFVQIDHTSSATGPMYYSGSPFSNPYVTARTTTQDATPLVDWWSNVYHLAVQVQQPATLPLATYQEQVAEINDYLDGALPAWCTWSIYQLSDHGATGFFLDEANLDLRALRI